MLETPGADEISCSWRMNLFLRYIPLGLLALLLWVLIRRRAYKKCPWFFAYVAFGVGADLARLTARLSASRYPGAHSATYWVTEGGYDVLGILVMYEVVRTVFGSLTSYWWTRLIFPVVLVVGVGMSLARAYEVPPQVVGILSYIVVGEIAVRFVQVIVPVLGVKWRQYPFGVATGFGVYSTVALLATTKYSDSGTGFKFLWAWTSVVAYSVAVLIWIWFFSVPQKVETSSSQLSIPSPGDLNQYKDVLRRMR
jgi:hypothetical protein